MTVSNELIYSTLESLRAKKLDALFKATPLIDVLKRKKAWKVGSYGPSIVIPVVTTVHSTLTAFPTGAERANQSVRDVLNKMEFYPADAGAPMFISRKVEQENKGPGAVVKLAETYLDTTMSYAIRELSKQLLAGSSVVLNDAGVNTLYGHSSVTSNGFLEGRTTQTNTIGGLAKNLGPIGLKNQWADVADDFSANGLTMMNRIMIKCRTYSNHGAPDIIMASEQAFENYKAALFTVERFTQKDDLDAGRLSLKHGEAEMHPDPDMPTSGTDDFEASAYFLNSKALEVAVWEGNDMDMGPWVDLANGEQVGRHAWLYFKLQLLMKQPAAHGFLADGNTN